MKDITLKITGKQFFNNVEEDQLEFVTDGKIYLKNDAVYVIYDESEFSGFEGCKTSLRVKGDTVRMKRIGSVEYDSELYFEKGKRFNSTYNTPYGAIAIEIITKCVENKLDTESMKGSVDIEYRVSLEGISEGINKLRIDVS